MPIAAHWRMLERNAALFVRGQGPRLTPQAANAPPEDVSAKSATANGAPARGTSSVEGERLAVPAGEVSGLTRALDFWWAYAIAAGMPALPVLGAVLLLLFLFVLEAARAWAGVRRLEVQPLPQAPDTWMA
jgi:hypothetical protein